jgi:gas vesicle protein
MKKLMVVILMALFAWNIDSALAQKPAVVLNDDPGWQKIGETVASFHEQDESIVVIGADEFDAIKLKIKDAPLEIERLQVFYESGEMEEIDITKQIKAGEESEVFTLENPERDIQKVAFTYQTVPNAPGEKADVELFGYKAGEQDRSSEAYRDDRNRGENELKETEEDIERESEQAGEDIEQGAERTESDLERAADKTGDAISEAAAKAASEITDERHDTKVGPDGQTIYIDDDTKYYYINDEGKKVYVSKIQLKDKPDKD